MSPASCGTISSNVTILADSTFSLSALEAKLVSYISDPVATSKPFELSAVPKISREAAQQEALRARTDAVANVAMAADNRKAVEGLPGAQAAPSPAEAQSTYGTQLSSVPELAGYGEIYKSSAKPQPLTESETEYVVSVVKHIFAEHVVFQVRSALLSAIA